MLFLLIPFYSCNKSQRLPSDILSSMETMLVKLKIEEKVAPYIEEFSSEIHGFKREGPNKGWWVSDVYDIQRQSIWYGVNDVEEGSAYVAEIPENYCTTDSHDEWGLLTRTVDIEWRTMHGDKTCPVCFEEIKAAATRCKHCGEELEAGRIGSMEVYAIYRELDYYVTLEEKQEPAPCAVLNFQWEPLDSISMFYDMGDIVSEYDFLSLVPDCGCD